MEEFDALMTLMNNVNFMDEVELELQDILAHTSDLEQMVIVYIISHLFAHVPRIRPDYSAAISLVGLVTWGRILPRRLMCRPWRTM